MPRETIGKTFTVAFLLCVACSVLVSSAAVVLRPTQAAQKALDKKRNILRPLAWELTDRTPCTSFCKRFEGSIELNGSGRFGFVDHEIYVPFELIDQCGLENYDFVRGLAISELNKKKNEYGWRALTLD